MDNSIFLHNSWLNNLLFMDVDDNPVSIDYNYIGCDNPDACNYISEGSQECVCKGLCHVCV